MEVEIVRHDKNEVELKLDNPTIAEILRVYLNKQGIEFAAWRREHPSKPVILLIKSSGKNVIKEVADAIEAVKKDLSKIVGMVKK